MEKPAFNRSLLHPRYWVTWFSMGLWWLVATLPYPLLLELGRRLGRLMYRIGGSRLDIARRNLELCFPELDQAAREQLLKRNFESYGIALFEVAISWWWPKNRFEKLVQVDGLEHIERLQGRGALLMALHYTTLEIGAQALSLRATIDAMYRPHNNPVYDYMQRRGRLSRSPHSDVYPRKDVRGMMKALRSGRVIWYAPDQDYGPKQSVFVPFFGIPAATVTATAKFAEMGKAAVLPFTQVRSEDGSGYRVTVHPPLEGFPSGDELADASRINQIVEGFIREHPDQYLWAHRRFKTRPPGEQSLYHKRKAKTAG